MTKPTKPVKRILNKKPSTGKPNNEWEKELDKVVVIFPEDKILFMKLLDFYSKTAIKDFISNLLQQQREDYEFTRKEIIEWLHEQNWKCEQLEKLLIQPKK